MSRLEIGFSRLMPKIRAQDIAQQLAINSLANPGCGAKPLLTFKHSPKVEHHKNIATSRTMRPVVVIVHLD